MNWAHTTDEDGCLVPGAKTFFGLQVNAPAAVNVRMEADTNATAGTVVKTSANGCNISAKGVAQAILLNGKTADQASFVNTCTKMEAITLPAKSKRKAKQTLKFALQSGANFST